MNNTIQYSVDNDGIATLMIDLPGKSMNVLCDEMISESKVRSWRRLKPPLWPVRI
jgi:hypothetical protein